MNTKRLSVFFMFVLLAALMAASFPPQTVQAASFDGCTPGKQVDKNAFFAEVARRLVNPSIPAEHISLAVQAFLIWEPWENTNACWNPLATTLPMPGSTKFNNANVQNYPDQETGIQATVITLNKTLSGTGKYYEPIRKMMARQEFNRAALIQSLRGWIGSESYSRNVVSKWEVLYNQSAPTAPPSVPLVFQKGISTLFQDQNWNRANLKVCAENLKGQTVYVDFRRDGRVFNVPPQKATSNCVTFWDMDAPGPMNGGGTVYYSRAALNQKPDPNWPIPCAGQTGGQGLCDAIQRP